MLAPVVSLPRFAKDEEFILETDARGEGLGAILLSQCLDDKAVKLRLFLAP